MAIVYGTAGNNTKYGTSASDAIYGYAQNDNFIGPSGNDTLYGWASGVRYLHFRFGWLCPV